MSKYDNIETAADLIREVRAHGLSTATEDIVRAQDILGHSTVGDIDFLASGGEKDCYGNAKHDWIQRTLFHVVFACWDLERAVALYNQHVTGYPSQLQEAQGKLRQEMEEHAAAKEMARTYHEELEAKKTTLLLAEYERDELRSEVQKLKAKLYDLMTAGD